jgi:hypothetical protein
MRTLLFSCAITCATVFASTAGHARSVRSSADDHVSQIGRYRSAAVARANGDSLARGGGPAEDANADPYVHERFSRDLADGCEYRADVRGAIRPARTEGAARVSADLTVRADLHCPNVASVQAPARRVALRATSPGQLAERLGGVGVVRASRDGSACSYEPVFAFRDGVLVNTDVSVSCGQ